MDGKPHTIVYDLYDEFDEKSGLASMARTTGFTATAHAELILQGRFSGKGVFPPELIGMDEDSFEFVMDYLEERNVKYKKTVN